MKDGAIREAMVLMAHGLQRCQYAEKLCTVDSRSGRHSEEREIASTECSTAASRWMD